MTAVPATPLIACGFHDAECSHYLADLPLWLALADTTGGPVVDLGAGTGRVSLPLAAAGHDVTAVDLDPDLLGELGRRAAAQGVTVRTIPADLRALERDLGGAVAGAALVLVPMQTIQLLGGAEGRRGLFEGAATIAAPGAELVISVVTEVEPFDGRETFPPLLCPDTITLDGYRFDSTPRAVLQAEPGDPIHMHRRRVVRGPQGEIVGHPRDVVITLDPVTIDGLLAEAAAAGWAAGEVIPVAPTDEHAGGTIIALRLAPGGPGAAA